MSDSRKIKFKTLDNNLTEIEVDANVIITKSDQHR
jgi:hypothetical protein